MNSLRAYTIKRVLDKKKTGRNIKAARKAKWLSIADFVALLTSRGCKRSRACIYLIEDGQRRPSNKMLRAIEACLNEGVERQR